MGVFIMYDEIVSVETEEIDFIDFIKIEKKPEVLIDGKVYFHIFDNLFLISSGEPCDPDFYKYFTNEYINIITNKIIINKPISDFVNSIFRESPKEKTKLKTFIYIMYDSKNDYYKIGISNNPKYREKTLQSEKPCIDLYLYFEGSYKDEQILHKKFNDKRIRGEWFNLTEEDISKIKEYFNK